MTGDAPAETGRPAEVHIALGSNLGDRAAELRAGLAALDAHPRIEVRAVSSVWESAYVGPGGAQPDYLNACAILRTDLAPGELLAALKAVERGRGRVGETHMRPRALDLDILVWGARRVETPDLVVPHPRLRERAFVLEPLAEIAPELAPPDWGQTVARRCAMIRAAEGCTAHRRPEIVLSSTAAEES